METFSLPIAHVRQGENKQVLAKQSLAEHLLAVAKLAKHFAKSAHLAEAGFILGLLHDFGKFSYFFQCYIHSSTGLLEPDSDDFLDPTPHKKRIDHSSAGAQILWQHFGHDPQLCFYTQILALCIASHHSGLIDCVAPNGDKNFLKRMAKDEAQTFLAECVAKSDPAILADVTAKHFPLAVKELKSVITAIEKRLLTQFSVKPGSQEYTDLKNSFALQKGLLIRFLLSCLVDADHTDSANFEAPKDAARRASLPQKPWAVLRARLEEHLAKMPTQHSIDAVRQNISEACASRATDPQGLFTLTVPTGGGKTLASLRFALNHANEHNLDRIIYIIPYTSIIEQNAEVARSILEKDGDSGNIVIEHHSDILPEKESWQNQLLAASWDAPVVFTTMVQFLEALFGAGTLKTRRMHSLARSVLIFDEIQTLPLRCVRLFCQALDFLRHTCRSSAVLCTATQPVLGALPRPTLGGLHLTPEQELAPSVPELFRQLRRVNFFDHGDAFKSAPEIAELALAETRESASCLVICNTKTLAEKIYGLCQSGVATDGAQVYYLSTSLCPAHRLAIFENITKALNKKKPVICVSTQLIECGVDISFGSVIRLTAGLDSILQAAGRCNRHGERERGCVHIVQVPPGEEYLDKLPDILHGQRIFSGRVREEWAQTLTVTDHDFTNPQIIESYFAYYYHEREKEMKYQVDTGRDDSLLSILGLNKKTGVSLPHNMLGQSFATAAKEFQAIEQLTQGIIVPYAEGADIIGDLFDSHSLLHRKKELLRKAQRYSVNVYPDFLRKLQKAGAIKNVKDSDVMTLDKSYYSENLGIVLEAHWNLDTLNI